MEINERDGYIIATILDDHDHSRVNVSIKGNGKDVYNLLGAIMRAIAADSGIDFEEVITVTRYLHYNRLQNGEE